MRHLRWILLLLAAVGIIGCDHVTKSMATATLGAGQAKLLIPGVLSLEHAQNTDTAFGLLSPILSHGPRLLLLKVTATLGVALVVWFAFMRFANAKTTERCALGLILGGAIGNAIDRWRWGYVVDFIHLEHWPIFNVADVALSVGFGLLVLAGLRRHILAVPLD